MPGLKRPAHHAVAELAASCSRGRSAHARLSPWTSAIGGSSGTGSAGGGSGLHLCGAEHRLETEVGARAIVGVGARGPPRVRASSWTAGRVLAEHR